jgi:hypothetical protein
MTSVILGLLQGTILGMPTGTYTELHVVISVIGIGSGLVVMWGMLRAKPLNGITSIFLVTTILTSLTGFAFPNEHITPAIVVGVLSMIMLAVAVFARYARHLAGIWRAAHVVTAAIALYFNVFVLIVQSFEKSAALHALAPTQKEPPFAIAQLVVLVAFVIVTVMAVRRFHPGSASVGTAGSQRSAA